MTPYGVLERIRVSRRFLIVDDSPVIRHTLQRMLSQQGIPEENIEVVEDAEGAIQRFEQDPHDVVFMDVDMPDMDGEQAANAILHTHPETKLVVVSGLNPDDTRVRNLVSLGAFEVVPKPVHSDSLRDLLHLIETEETGGGRIH